MRPAPARRLLAFAALLALLLGSRPAAADEWGDARKAFRAAQKSPDVHVRSTAFMDLLNFDGTEQATSAVDEIFRALSKEESPAVVLAGINTLSTFMSDPALAAIRDELQKGRGERRLYALLAVADRPAGGGEDLLLAELDSRDEPVVAQAAVALGRRRVQAALPRILPMLQSRTWQLRSAAARALERMAGDPVKDPKTGEAKLPPLPAWLDPQAVVPALVASLESAEGVDRGDILSALIRITQQDYGYDLDAWKALASGTDPAQIRAGRSEIPYVCGIPIFGRRVVVLMDISTCTDDTHPFPDLDRLKEVLSVPGARPVALPTVRTTKEFMAAHAKRLIEDLPTKGQKLEVIAVFQKTEPLFGRLTNANTGTKKHAQAWIDELSVQGGPNHYEGLTQALDISGAKDSIAWSLGPDEIVLMTCAIPWAPKDPSAIVDQTEVGAAIGLKARLRMVPIHTIGVGPHPFEMMRTISEQSGGRYLDLSK